MDTFSSQIRRRLRALIAQHRAGLINDEPDNDGAGSCRSIERAMGRSNSWLRRKLIGERPLNLRDVDEVLEHLKEPPGALLD